MTLPRFYPVFDGADWVARGLACGRIFDRSGRLVATTTQEAMIRLPEQD